MKTSTKPLKISEEQALYFRSRRGFLAGDGATSPAECARNLFGLQAQQLAPGLLALSQRLATRPTAQELEQHLFSEKRDLVRTWGQRDTIHIYDARHHWQIIVAAREQWSPGGRGGPLPSQKSEKAALRVALKKKLVTRKDFLPQVETSYLAELDPRIGDDHAKANFACGRLIWRLSQDGAFCFGEKEGSRQIYATRQHFFPGLDWPECPQDPLQACVSLTRDYLAINAPATAQDVAHFFGATVTAARRWLAELSTAGELIPVQCNGRKDLLALATDEEDLQILVTRSRKKWPVRLLPLWDTLLMSHKDKSWTLPELSEHPLVWRKAAYVSSVVLARGRIVAVWKMKRKGKRLDFELEPLASWNPDLHLAGFRREARQVAAHLQLIPGAVP